MPLTLTVKHNDRYYNINIRQRPDCLFALGYEKPSERVCTLLSLVVLIYLVNSSFKCILQLCSSFFQFSISDIYKLEAHKHSRHSRLSDRDTLTIDDDL